MAKRKYRRTIFRKIEISPGLRRLRKFKINLGLASGLLRSAGMLFLIGLLTGLSLFFYYAKDLPRPEKFTERQIIEPTKIYDRTGEHLLYTIFGEEKREIVLLEAISEHVKQAVIAAEDADFYQHHGISFKGIVRAVMVRLRLKKSSFLGQGASTISQQLIRSTFLTTEKTAERKIREIVLTLELDRRYEKDQILEWYLNQVPFGSNAYGIEAASQTFFNKTAKDLTLAEAACLASLIQAPTYLSPYGQQLEALLERKNYILNRMAAVGYIAREQAEEAQQEELKFAKAMAPIKAPHFVIYVRKLLIEKYGEDYLKTKGLKIYTSLDISLQEAAEKAMAEHIKKNESLGAFNAALVAIDPKTGEILSLIGSKSYFAESYPKNCLSGQTCKFEPEFDVATLGLRQPGSSFKPIVYATAFKNGFDDNYVVIDELTNFGIYGGKPYIPQNYDGRFRGPVTLRQALAQSLNIPAVKVLVNLAGIEQSLKTAADLGITTFKEASFYGPALVLGGGEVKLIEMVSAFSVFANQGFKNKPVAIIRIEDNQGNVLEKYTPSPRRVLKETITETITSILADNQARSPVFGANSFLNIEGVSVKTGTTQNYNDAWAIGYNQKIAAGVWAGNNDNSPSYSQPGIALAGPIWHDFMVQAINLLGK